MWRRKGACLLTMYRPSLGTRGEARRAQIEAETALLGRVRPWKRLPNQPCPLAPHVFVPRWVRAPDPPTSPLKAAAEALAAREMGVKDAGHVPFVGAGSAGEAADVAAKLGAPAAMDLSSGADAELAGIEKDVDYSGASVAELAGTDAASAVPTVAGGAVLAPVGEKLLETAHAGEFPSGSGTDAVMSVAADSEGVRIMEGGGLNAAQDTVGGDLLLDGDASTPNGGKGETRDAMGAEPAESLDAGAIANVENTPTLKPEMPEAESGIAMNDEVMTDIVADLVTESKLKEQGVDERFLEEPQSMPASSSEIIDTAANGMSGDASAVAEAQNITAPANEGHIGLREDDVLGDAGLQPTETMDAVEGVELPHPKDGVYVSDAEEVVTTLQNAEALGRSIPPAAEGDGADGQDSSDLASSLDAELDLPPSGDAAADAGADQEEPAATLNK